MAMVWNDAPVEPSVAAPFRLKRLSDPESLARGFTVPFDRARPMKGFRFQLIGRVADEPITWSWKIAMPDGTLLAIEVWWLQVPISPSLSALRIFSPNTGESRRSIEVFSDRWDDEWNGRVAARAKLALKALDMLPTTPGPKAGTVAKFKSREQWLDAIRSKVMTRQTRATANDERIAAWLGISPSLLYDLMRRWGPPRNLDELRAGNF